MGNDKQAKSNIEDWRQVQGTWRIGKQAIFDPKALTVTDENETRDIENRDAELLRFLITRRDQWVTLDEIAFDGPWGHRKGAIDKGAIHSSISGIRKALGYDNVCLASGKRGSGSYILKSATEEGGQSWKASAQARQTGTTVGYTAAAVIAVVIIAGGAFGLMSVFNTGNESPQPTPAPGTPPVVAGASAETDVQYGALSALREDYVARPNITSDWLSRVTSGNTYYSPPTSRADVAYADGLQAYARGDLERARQRIEAALEASPDTPDYKAGLVAIAAAAGNLEGARRILGELEDATLKYPQPTRLAARLRYYTHAGDKISPEERLEAFDDLLEQMESVFAGNSTAVAGALAGRGRALAALERWDESRRALQDAEAISKNVTLATSTWWWQTLMPDLGRAARQTGHCDAEVPRLKAMVEIPTMGQDYDTLEAAIAIEAVRCLDVLGRLGEAVPYLDALHIASRNGVLTTVQREQIVDFAASVGVR